MEMLNLENLFSNVKIENDKRLSAEDINFLELQEKIYATIYENLDTYQKNIKLLCENEIKNLNEKYNYTNNTKYTFTFTNANSYGNIDIKGQKNKINENFISGICSYFEHYYDIKIDYESIEKTLKDKKINYNDIIELIFKQLGGFSFEEKAERQIIDALVDLMRYKKIKISNKKISISNMLYIDTTWGGTLEVHYNSKDDLNNLLKAINNYEKIDNSFLNYANMSEFKDYEFNGEKIIALKMFKNGRVDIIFSNGLHSLNFAKKYLGYQE